MKEGPKVQIKVKDIVFGHCSELLTHTTLLLSVIDLAEVSCSRFHGKSQRDLKRYMLHPLSTPSLADFA